MRRLKSEIFAEEHVNRAIDYYLSAARPGVTPERALARLYKLCEMLEDYFDAGEKGLAERLGMPLSRIKDVKKLANRPEHDARHANAGATSDVTPGELVEALEIAREMIQRFIAARYQERTGPVTPST